MRLTRSGGVAACAIALALQGVPALGQELAGRGDGSGTNNSDFLRKGNEPCAHCVPNAPPEWNDPLADLDWSLGLRAGLQQGPDGAQYSVIALPSVSLTRETLRGSYDFGLTGEVSHEFDGSGLRVDAISGTAGGRYALDEVTVVDGRLNLTLSQDDADDPDYASNVSSAPLEAVGELDVSASREFGPLSATVRANVGRSTYGDTEYDDGTSSGNGDQNSTWFGTGARLGYALTPGLEAFADVQVDLERFDEASPELAARLDSATYAGRTGLLLQVDPRFEVEGSVGLGYRDFSDGAVADVPATLYALRGTYRPTETVTLAGTFSTDITSPGQASGASAAIEHAATVDLNYRANPWLRLRANAGWSELRYQAIDSDKHVWGLGVGADYLLNETTDLTADYSFERTERTPEPATDTHQIMLGVLLHR